MEFLSPSDTAAEPAPEVPPQAQALLDAVIAISTDLDLKNVLARIIESASDLTNAQYGALCVIGHDGDSVEFITNGIDPPTRESITSQPSGRGVLRLPVEEPQTIRPDDVKTCPNPVGSPDIDPPMISYLGVPIRARGTLFGNLYLTQKTGGQPFTAQDEVLVEGLASAAGFVIENARAYGRSERRRQWLEATAELNDALQPPIELATALDEITHRARRISGATVAALVQYPDDGHPLIVAADGATAERIEPLLEPARVIVERDDGVGTELPVEQEVAVVLPLHTHLLNRSALITMYDRAHRKRGERDMLAAFADQAGLALDRAQAVEDGAQHAVISERERIARDLHDVVIQRLFGAGLQLRGLRASAPAEENSARVDQVVDALDLTITEIRSTIFALQNAPRGES